MSDEIKNQTDSTETTEVGATQSTLKDKIVDGAEAVFEHIDRNKKRYMIGAAIVGIGLYLLKNSGPDIVIFNGDTSHDLIGEL